MKIIEINTTYWLGDHYCNEFWSRLTLFFKKVNNNGEVNNTPIAEINIIKHPGLDSVNPHFEVIFLFRSNLKKRFSDYTVIKQNKTLSFKKLINPELISIIEDKLLKLNIISEPYCFKISTVIQEDFFVKGDFYNWD